MSFVCWGPQNWMQHSRWHPSSVECRGRIPCLILLAIKIHIWHSQCSCLYCLSYNILCLVLWSRKKLVHYYLSVIMFIRGQRLFPEQISLEKLYLWKTSIDLQELYLQKCANNSVDLLFICQLQVKGCCTCRQILELVITQDR